MNKIISIFLLTMFSLSLSQAEEKYEKCLDALKNKDYASAIPCLRDALRKEKKNPKGFIVLAKALMEIDSAAAAVAPIIQARELDPENRELYILLGDSYVKQEIYSAAVDPYLKAAEMDSSDAGVHEKLGDVYFKLRKYTEAATQFRQVIARDTSNYAMYQKLGNLLFRAKQYNASLQFLYYFVTRVPNNSNDERLSLVTAMFLGKRYDELLQFAKGAVAVPSISDSLKTSLLHILAFSYARTKDYPNAESSYVLLQQKDTLSAEEYFELAKVYKAVEKPDSAISAYEKASMKDSTMSAIYYDLGTLYMAQKKFAEAASAFQRKIATDTSAGFQFASNLNAAICLMQIKEFNTALGHIKAGLALRPDYIAGWSSLGSCYAQMDSTPQQRAANQKVIDLITAGSDSSIEKNKDKLGEAYRVEGVISFQEKRYERALEYLKKAAAIDPKNCQTNILIANCYVQLKNNDDAKKYLCKVFSACPKNEDAKKLGAFLGVEAGDCGK